MTKEKQRQALLFFCHSMIGMALHRLQNPKNFTARCAGGKVFGVLD
jgi:hypothetical protein